MVYNTKQKDIVLNKIISLNKDFTIKELYNSLNKKVGLTTIYRLVDKLVEDKIINKTIGKDNITYYQYLEECSCDNHFYLKCENCGYMINIDCDCIEDLKNHIKKEHSFKPTSDHIIINGLCKKCSK